MTTSGFTYDDSGNITDTGPSPTLTYNLENFMTAAGSSTYGYDAEGRRVKKTVSGATTDYFYSGGVVLSEKQGSSWTDYIFFGGQRIAKQTGASLSTATFIHTDHLGSTRVCTNSSGNSTGTCTYEPFGEFQPPGVSACTVPTNYRFAGMEYDSESEFYHTWFRQYDTKQGRWLSVDPLPGSSDAPQSLNRYAYVLNDPVDLVDPLGLDEDCAFYVVIPEYGGVEGIEIVGFRIEGYFCGGRGSGGRHGGEAAQDGGGGGEEGEGPIRVGPPGPPAGVSPPSVQDPQSQQKFQDCLARKAAEADAARAAFRNAIDKRVLRMMGRGAAVGAVRGAVWGAAAGTPEFGIGAVPGAIFGGVVGGVVGAGASAISTIFVEPFNQWRYDRFTYKPASDRAAIECAIEVNTAPPSPPR